MGSRALRRAQPTPNRLRRKGMLQAPSLIRSDLRTALREAIFEDKQNGAFKVNRRVFVDAQVLEAERRVIFDHCWLYLGHASEVAAPGSFLTRSVGGRRL